MTDRDVRAIVDILNSWKRPPLRWTEVQSLISTTVLDGQESWSRQSLQDNEEINIAWLNARARLSGGHRRAAPAEVEPSSYEKLVADYAALEAKYQNLALRHRQLLYNASMLPGGTRLLLDPLPDNTPAQRNDAGSRRPRRK